MPSESMATRRRHLRVHITRLSIGALEDPQDHAVSRRSRGYPQRLYGVLAPDRLAQIPMLPSSAKKRLHRAALAAVLSEPPQR